MQKRSAFLFIALLSVSAATRGAGASPSTPAPHKHRRCGWVFTNEPAGSDAFVKNVDAFDAIHPVWYALQSDGHTIRPLADADDPVILDAAHKHGVAVIPLVASVDDVAYTRAMMTNPANMAAHVQALVDLAVSHNYDGLDLDYEHLTDGDGPPLAAFVQAISTAMHKAGKTISMAVPALDGPSKVWDYGLVAGALDQVHVMGYDFHYLGGAHAGATAPLGWIDAVGAYIASSSGGHPERFILGLPNYGLDTASVCDLGACQSRCGAPAQPDTAEMASCTLNVHHYAPGRVLACRGPSGIVYFDDAASIDEKAHSARAHGLGGLSYWKLGGEPAGFFDSFKRYY